MSDRALSRALRWPLWSWRNLAVTVGAVLLLGALVGRLTGGSSGQPAGAAVGTRAASTAPLAASAAATQGRATPSSATGGASGPVADEARGDAAARAAATERATAFVQAWLRPGNAQQRTQWLRPVSGDRLVAQLAGLPASALARHPVGAATVVAVDQAEATVTVPMSDGRTAVLGLTAEADGWRVASLSTTPTAPSASASAASSGAAAG